VVTPEELADVLESVLGALEAGDRASEANPLAPEWAKQLVNRVIRATTILETDPKLLPLGPPPKMTGIMFISYWPSDRGVHGFLEDLRKMLRNHFTSYRIVTDPDGISAP
jgi:hypothetical protein